MESPGTERKQVSHGLNGWIVAFILGLIALLIARWVHEYTPWHVPEPLLGPISTLSVILAIYLLAALFVRLTVHIGVKLFSSEQHIEQQLILRKFYIALVYCVATLIALWRLGLSSGDLTVFVGLATTGFGFALRDIVSSYFVWFMLLAKKPFHIGDYIRIGEDEGRVMHIGTFYVVLDENPETRADYVRVPNQRFLAQSFYNFGHDELLVQVRVPVTEFSTDIDARLERVRVDLAREHPTPKVMLDTFHDKVVVMIETHTREASRTAARDKIIRAVVREFGSAKRVELSTLPKHAARTVRAKPSRAARTGTQRTPARTRR